MTSTFDVDHARLLGTEPSTVTSSGSATGAHAIALRLFPRKLTSGGASRSRTEPGIPDGLAVAALEPVSNAQPLNVTTNAKPSNSGLHDDVT
jgi:hypothetical protein